MRTDGVQIVEEAITALRCGIGSDPGSVRAAARRALPDREAIQSQKCPGGA